MSPLSWLWWRRELPEPFPPAPAQNPLPVAVVEQAARPEMPPTQQAAAGAEPLPGRGQEAAPREVLSSDPEARDLFLAGIRALDTMARWRRQAEGVRSG